MTLVKNERIEVWRGSGIIPP